MISEAAMGGAGAGFIKCAQKKALNKKPRKRRKNVN
jgi:hypothetical protein